MASSIGQRVWRAILSAVTVGLLSSVLFGCGGATKAPPPQRPGTAALTAAPLRARIQRVLVADKGTLSTIDRDGCMATLRSVTDSTGDSDELRIACPRSERLAMWFGDLERMSARIPLQRVNDDDEDVRLPAAELLTATGSVLRVTRSTDVERMFSAMRAFNAELTADETPDPGPKSPLGFQMLRVMGPARVFLGGARAEGVLDVRVSTSGQYLCEFMANTHSGPLRATKSGFIGPAAATKAIDEVLTPFHATGPGVVPRSTFAAAIVDGAERRADAASTAAVFERFAPVQDALGDACLPELDPPPPVGL
jgi:hypothetical protein